MKPGLDWIIGIVDKSGSMAGVRDDAIGGINVFISDQQKQEGRTALMTLALFDVECQVLSDLAPIAEVQPLTQETYVPGNQTALFDAIGRMISEADAKLIPLPEEERPETVTVAILTDGHENSSRYYTRSQIRQTIEYHQAVPHWKIIWLAATQEGIQDAQSLGVSGATTFSYSAADTRSGFQRLSQEVSHYRTAGGTTVPPKKDQH